MSVMLKRLYIHNFKSFWESEFNFGKVNCFIAPNNAGKSNLIEALELLNNILKKDLSKAFTLEEKNENYRYSEEEIVIKAIFLIKNMALIDNNFIQYEIETAIDIKLSLKELNFDILVKNEGKIKGILVDSNDVKKNSFIVRNYNEKIVLILDNYEKYVEKLDKKRFTKLEQVEGKKNKLFRVLTGYDEVSQDNFSEIIQNIFATKSLMSSFYFHPEAIKYTQVYETDFLLKDGTNLAYFLNTLDNKTFEDINISLIGEVELIESIEISDGAIPHIVFNENVDGKTSKIIYQKVSDGTIHFLALMTALYASKSEILILEEPERHMHMKVLSYILNTMRDSDKQIFFTTHSTEILQQLELDEILFMFRDFDGDTKGKRAIDVPHIKDFMKRYKNDLLALIQVGIVGEYEEY